MNREEFSQTIQMLDQMNKQQSSVLLACRIPRKTKESIELICDQMGISVSEFMRQSLISYLEYVAAQHIANLTLDAIMTAPAHANFI